METSFENKKMSFSDSFKVKIETIIRSKWFMYCFMVSLLIYLLISGYILYFSGSLFIEAIVKGWYMTSSTEYEYHSFFLGYLYGFASLFAVIGGLAILSTKPERFFKHKVLLIIPSVVWAVFLVLDIFRWGAQYWTQWLYLVPILLLCLFVLFGVVKKIRIPFFADSKYK